MKKIKKVSVTVRKVVVHARTNYRNNVNKYDYTNFLAAIVLIWTSVYIVKNINIITLLFLLFFIGSLIYLLFNWGLINE